MRVLHTADWHLGQRFHDQLRDEDESHALEQILCLSRERGVDAVLVSGDVFDHPNPGARQQRLYYETLAKLVTEAGVATVVVTAGNHDSALRLEGPSDLLGDLGIYVVGRWPREAASSRPVLPLRDRRGEIRAACVAVPYLRDADLRLPAIGEAASEVHQRYARALEGRYERAAKEARARYPGLPLVVMGHCYVASALLGGGERPVQIGNLAQVDARALAAEGAYLALGHLHRPQTIQEKDHWRYSGSLLPTGFDEIGQRRQVILFDIPERDGEVAGRITAVDLEPFRSYRRLEGTPAEVREASQNLPLADAAKPTPWCEATLELSGPEPGLARELIDVARDRGWNLVSVKRRPRAEGEEASTPGSRTAPAPDLRELEPEQVFERCHVAEFGEPPDDELRLEFRSLLEEVTAGVDETAAEP
ncbi:MAG: exonuclease SbcCD subunit D [Acidobacteriota bacterium]